MATPKLIQLKFWGIVESHKDANAYALLLVADKDDRHLPVIIGHTEAQHILIAQKRIDTPLPLPHKLVINMLKAFEYKLKHVEIHRETEGLFHAWLVVESKETGELKRIDARISDVVAVALKMRRKIMVHEAIFEALAVSTRDVESGEMENFLSKAVSADHTEEELRKKMQQAVANEDYELAASVRDALAMLEKFNKEQLL